MTMNRRLRTFALTTHLAVSVGWIGSVIAYLALGITAVNTNRTEVIRAAWIGMELIGWFAIVPLAIASLITGLIMSLGTRWGLFRHYWVFFSFVLTVIATAVLLLHMPDVSDLTDFAQTADGESLRTLGGDLGHPSIGLVILLVIHVLNVYKPKGLTRYGRRKQAQNRPVPQSVEGT